MPFIESRDFLRPRWERHGASATYPHGPVLWRVYTWIGGIASSGIFLALNINTSSTPNLPKINYFRIKRQSDCSETTNFRTWFLVSCRTKKKSSTNYTVLRMVSKTYHITWTNSRKIYIFQGITALFIPFDLSDSSLQRSAVPLSLPSAFEYPYSVLFSTPPLCKTMNLTKQIAKVQASLS